MAKLSAHGHEIGTIEFTTSAKRYMSDGVILKNRGDGWKLYGKVKNVTPQVAFENAQAHQARVLEQRPALRAYRKELHSIAGQCKRWKLDLAISLMPDDCDGVWSEACDGYGDNVSASVNEVAELCRLYRVAAAEQKALKADSAAPHFDASQRAPA